MLTYVHKLIENGVNERVKVKAEFLLKKLTNEKNKKEWKTSSDEEKKRYKDLKDRANKWLKEIKSDVIKVIPSMINYTLYYKLFFAIEKQIDKYDVLIKELENEFPNEDFDFDEKESVIFINISNDQGNLLEGKFVNYLSEWNQQGFEPVWEGFLQDLNIS